MSDVFTEGLQKAASKIHRSVYEKKDVNKGFITMVLYSIKGSY